jgi:hypothetical protein
VEIGDVEIGMQLEVGFDATENGGAIPVFRPIGADEQGGPS